MEGDIKEILQACEAIKFGHFKLASGKYSNYYIDVRRAVTKPKILGIICDYIIEKMKNHVIDPDYIACVELGGVPIGVLVADRTGLPLIIVRKETKDHGIKGRLMGFEKGKDPIGTVLLLEDVTTTGSSAVSAIDALKDEGLHVEAMITVVDRQEGAEEIISGMGILLISLITAGDILRDENEDSKKRYKELRDIKRREDERREDEDKDRDKRREDKKNII